MRRGTPSLLILLALLLPLALAGGCGRERTLEPRTGTGVALKVRVAPRGAAEPIVGVVDTIQVAIQDTAGVDVVPPLNLPIAAGQKTFQAVIDLLPATDLVVTIRARGSRDVAGRSERGLLWHDRVEGVAVVADQTTLITALLESFVPQLGPVEYPGGTQHRIRWGRVPGAVNYRVAWRSAGGDGSATTADTTFAADGFGRTYEVASLDATGEASPPGDPAVVSGPPAPTIPAGLSVTGVDPNRIDLAWQLSTGVAPIRYDLQRRVLPSPFGSDLLATGLEAPAFVDNGVSPEPRYAYRVRAVGPGGASDWSTEVEGASLVSPPTAPRDLVVTLIATTTLRVGWTAPSGIVDGFDLERRIPPSPFAPLATLPATQTGLDDSDLAENTRYEYRVAARNRGGQSPFSLPASGTTGIHPPLAPSGLVASSTRIGEIDLAWIDNSDNEDGFELQRAPGGGGAFTTLVTLVPNTTSHVDGNLPEQTPYRYRVRAIRGTLASPFSAEASATTPGRFPAAPTNLAGQPLTPRSVRLTWTDNSDNEVSFRVERETPPTWTTAATASANVVTIDIPDLTPGTNHTFRVVAVNGTGDSDPSNAVTIRTPPETPNPPSSLLATEVRHNRVHLTWQDNSANEQGFEIRRTGGTGGTQIFEVGADINNYEDGSVASRTGYTYEVRAFAGSAFSAFTGPIAVTTPIAPPTNLVATTLSTSQIGLGWTAPPGSISFFDIQSRIPPAAFAQFATVTGTSTTFTATGLKSNTTYEFQVRARFNQETSEYSNVASATTLLAPPAAPSQLEGEATNARTIALNWRDNADNEAGFEVEERRQGENNFVTVATPDSNVTSALLTSRTSNTTYEYRVRAVNAAGPSGYSNLVVVTTPNEPPATPTNLTAFGGLDRVDLFWIPGIGGGSPIDYRIERRVQGEPAFDEIGVASALQTDYGDLGLPTGTTYEYRIRARNNLGFSGYSDTVTVTTVLAPPSNLTGLIDPTTTTVLLFWSDNTTTESGFEIQRADAGGVLNWAPLVTLSENLTFYYDQAVVLGQTYVYRIRAFNKGGFSAWSNEFSILVEEFPLQIPFNLVPHPVGGSDINFTWVDTNFNETGYQFQLGFFPVSTSGVFTILRDVVTATNVTNVPITGLGSGTVYSARVRALGAGGASSAWLGFVCASTGATGPNAPTGLTATYLSGPDAVQLTWIDNSCNEERFEIYQTFPSSEFDLLVGTVEPNTTLFLVPNVTTGTKFYYVRSINAEASGYSGTVSITVP